MMKVLLLGANGQLGTQLRAGLAPLGEVVPATRTGRLDDGTPCEAVDLEQLEAFPQVLERIRPDVLVNTAAFTAVDLAESRPEVAFAVNAQAPALLAEACARQGVRLVHYSTDYVFDGASGQPYRENDGPHPLNQYGASKLAGEQAVQASPVQALIFRVSWIFAAHGNSFLRSVLRWSNERASLQVVDDQVGIPTSARLIAYATEAALRQMHAGQVGSGLWHLTASGQTSRHAFAEAIVREAHARGLVARPPRIEAVSSAQFSAPARRPHYSVLNNDAFQDTFGLQLPNWYEGMVEVLDTLAAQR